MKPFLGDGTSYPQGYAENFILIGAQPLKHAMCSLLWFAPVLGRAPRRCLVPAVLCMN